MGNIGYIVLALVNNTVEVDSIWTNLKKAQKRKEELDNNSDGAGLIIDKWINPKIILSAEEYTNDRASKKTVLNSPLICDKRCFELLNNKIGE